MNRPNILLILTDQHRYDTIGANGSAICRTPSLDGLAQSGTNFRQAYSICGLCTPCRASIYTGLLPHKHGLMRNVDDRDPTAIRPDHRTIAELLKEEDYRCHFVGKWHAGSRLPTACGFEGMDIPGYGNIRDSSEYRSYLEAEGLDLPEVEARGVGWSENLMLAGVSSGPIEASVPYFLAEKSIEVLSEWQSCSKPFLLALNFWGPHAPYVPCEPYASMYDPESIPPWGNFNDDFQNKPPVWRRYRDAFIGEGNPQRSWQECARWAALYYGFTTQIDAQIGRVLAALDELGLAENTAVIFSCDHGDLTGAHGGMHDKAAVMCQELYHIPFITRLGWMERQNRTETSLISNLSIAPTILDLAGCEIPERMDARSLLPLMSGQQAPDWPDFVVGEFFGNHYGYETRMVIHKGFKYIFHPGAFDELYDLSNDPWELKNLIDSPEHTKLLGQIRSRLLDWGEKTGDEPDILSILSGLFSPRKQWSQDTVRSYEDLFDVS